MYVCLVGLNTVRKVFFAVFVFLWSIIGVQADVIDDAIANSHRSEADVNRDKYRKPAKVLRFLNVKEGTSVFDIFAGGGYYSELLSYAVGPSGSVTMYNNTPWDDFVGKQVDGRLFEDRLPNVFRYIEKPEQITLHAQKYDLAIFILGMHDIYYEDVKGGWPAIDKQKFLSGIYHLVKAGGTLGVIDHIAKTDQDPAVSGKSIHRIEPAVVIKDLESVGFTLEMRSKMLENPFDDLTSNATATEHRGRTSRLVLLFRK